MLCAWWRLSEAEEPGSSNTILSESKTSDLKCTLFLGRFPRQERKSRIMWRQKQETTFSSKGEKSSSANVAGTEFAMKSGSATPRKDQQWCGAHSRQTDTQGHGQGPRELLQASGPCGGTGQTEAQEGDA
nr:guanine nucleotide-binding protein G(I)/G(S)/G(O) subunit gamma-T2 isoform X5 [Mirounga angustirostris]